MPEEPQGLCLTTITSTLLLEQLKDPRGQTAWQQFVDRYEPMLVRYGRRLGLREEDARDAAQEALMTFCVAYKEGKYHREKGRLRNWLFGMARNHILRLLQAAGKEPSPPGGRTDRTDLLAQVPAEDEWEEIWGQEWREAVVRQCLQEVRKEFDAKTVRAFELFTGQDWPAERVARELGMTENAVYLAKSRILRRIRRLIPRMEETW
jgi:RNA polymerase sigma-70 factor (ECF subfamily)